MKERGLRYNSEKIRLELVPTELTEGVGKVLTYGAKKYTVYNDANEKVSDGANNWRKGLSWMETYGSCLRHLEAFVKGEDFDPESGHLHLEHAATNIAFLLSFYKSYPQGDDRIRKPIPRIGLDIDDVLADWVPTFCKLAGVTIPEAWNFGFPDMIKSLIDGGLNYQEVMATLPVKTSPNDIPFEPTCYITNRGHTDVQLAKDWIKNNGFPQVPVIQTTDKITAAKEMNLDIFVDDKYETFEAMNAAGICTYLFDAPHNRRYNVGYKRIKSLKELI